MSGMLVWAVILFLAGLTLLVLEAFIPSGGLLGVLSVISLVAGIIFGYMGNWVEGTIILAATVVGVPTAVVLMLKYWPETPIGRRVLLGVPEGEKVLPDLKRRKTLVGKRGRTQNVLLPSGPVEIEGELIDAVSEGMVIEAGELVEVVEARGMRVVVRSVAAGDEDDQIPISTEDPLASPVDALELQPLSQEPAEPLTTDAADPPDMARKPSKKADQEGGSSQDAQPEGAEADVFATEFVLDEDDDESGNTASA